MSNPFSITFNYAPYVTIERYAEISGLPVETVRKHIKKGMIKTKPKPISEKASRTRSMINLLDVFVDAAKESKHEISIIFGS